MCIKASSAKSGKGEIQVKKIVQQEKEKRKLKIDSPAVWASPKRQGDCPFKIAFCLDQAQTESLLLFSGPSTTEPRPNHSRTESQSHANSSKDH
jgi:hypothetical protein